MPAHPFLLRKWYADCVTDAGDAVICYVAGLAMGPARLSYGAVIERTATGVFRQRQTMRPGTLSRIGESLQLDIPRLGVTGAWTGGGGSGPQSLLASAPDAVTWEALTLAATVDVGSGPRRYCGTGYAEVVTLTVPPWTLPLADLRWGRFVADDASTGLTWIDWRDADGVRLVDGEWASPGLPSAPGSAAGLVLSDTRPIRSGPVSESLLGRARRLASVLPRGVADLDEQKLLSRGRLGGSGAEGWVVHERVGRP